jgi:hypothetical protein
MPRREQRLHTAARSDVESLVLRGAARSARRGTSPKGLRRPGAAGPRGPGPAHPTRRAARRRGGSYESAHAIPRLLEQAVLGQVVERERRQRPGRLVRLDRQAENRAAATAASDAVPASRRRWSSWSRVSSSTGEGRASLVAPPPCSRAARARRAVRGAAWGAVPAPWPTCTLRWRGSPPVSRRPRSGRRGSPRRPRRNAGGAGPRRPARRRPASSAARRAGPRAWRFPNRRRGRAANCRT